MNAPLRFGHLRFSAQYDNAGSFDSWKTRILECSKDVQCTCARNRRSNHHRAFIRVAKCCLHRKHCRESWMRWLSTDVLQLLILVFLRIETSNTTNKTHRDMHWRKGMFQAAFWTAARTRGRKLKVVKQASDRTSKNPNHHRSRPRAQSQPGLEGWGVVERL